MGRPERQVDPDAGPVQRFAWELRQLRQQAGRPSYRALAARVHYSASMLSEAAAGLALPSLAVTLAYVRGCGGDPQLWEQRWRRLAAEIAGGPGADAGKDVGEEPPYLGLSTFQATDAARFFGRRALIDELSKRLADEPFLTVFGASGSGKSSLLRAGLLPALAAGSAPDGRTSVPLLMTPGAEPLQELAAGLAKLQGLTATALHAELAVEPAAGPLAVRQALTARPGADLLVLVVDQFEEVFTLCRDEQTRQRFLDCLLKIADGCAERARVVLGVRADFYPHCARHAGLVSALRDRQLLVGPMDEADLRAVVTGPAEHAGYRVEPALLEAVVADAAGQPGALPLVSHALLETWQRRQSGMLTLAGYRDAGGVADAIAQTAERVYGDLDPARRHIVQDIFLRLTALGQDTEDTRRRVGYAELLGSPATADVLDRLARARLVTCDEDTATVAHEALIRRWPRLRGWLAADRNMLLQHRRLTEVTAEWQQHRRDDAFLYRGARLAPWRERPLDRLNELEQAFLTASRLHENRRRGARRRRVQVAGALLCAVVLVVATLAAISTMQARRAADERDLAVSNELAARAREQLALKPESSLALAKQAMAVRRTPTAQAVLRQAAMDSRIQSALPAGQGQVFGVAYSPDGQSIATSGDNGTVRVWRLDARGVATGTPRVLIGHADEVWSPVFSPDGRRLAACGIDGTVTVWELGADRPALVQTGHTDKVWNVAFSPDGQRLASTSDDGTVRIWDIAGGPARTVLRPGDRQLGVAFSPDGRHLATGDGAGVVRLWPASGVGTPKILRGHTDSVENVMFSADSQALASASTDGTIRVWPVAGTEKAVVLNGEGSSTAETVAFSPDGHRIASGGSDGTVRVFNTDSDADPLVLPGHDGPVWSVAFSPDGRRLASGSGDGSVRFWDPAYPGAPRVLRGHQGAVAGIAVSADGRRLVTGGQDGTVRLWPPGGPAGPTVLRGHTGEVFGVAVTADGTRVASAGADHTVRVWDAATGRVGTLSGHSEAVFDVAFLPDGRRLASAGRDGTVRVWDLATGRAVTLGGHTGTVRSVAAGPDGRHVASAGRDGTVRVWDLETGQALVLHGHQGGLVWKVTFSPDGRHVASGGHDGTIRVWDTATGQAVTVLRGHRGAVWNVAYSPDGGLIASSGDDGGLRIWRTTEDSTPVVVRGFGSAVEVSVFEPGGDRLATVHDDGTLRSWQCEACAR
ncbi:hypothetical protein QLQ12_43450 [Actinoplanes sp. NEAU-A12]|uniref:HTH cro/C1-type domain-containing protein n=1 Tax=Actinoplanes sandaracinus TaxID=3045177 RepID=A0ABT6X0C5_9ACTN|nr:hypothetical protein [Actinoplanes sandaracinus]MDI6105461.1 hypothetical protein [Actinoplanes sandaracinus]